MRSITKQEMIEVVWRRMGRTGRSEVTRKQVTEILEEVFWQVGQGLRDRKRFTWPGFGTFTAIRRSARKGRNPQTDEPIDIPSRIRAKFSASKDLDRRMNREA